MELVLTAAEEHLSKVFGVEQFAGAAQVASASGDKQQRLAGYLESFYGMLLDEDH
jgi:hypothetical protein